MITKKKLAQAYREANHPAVRKALRELLVESLSETEKRVYFVLALNDNIETSIGIANLTGMQYNHIDNILYHLRLYGLVSCESIDGTNMRRHFVIRDDPGPIANTSSGKTGRLVEVEYASTDGN